MIPFVVNNKEYTDYRTFRVAILGDVGRKGRFVCCRCRQIVTPADLHEEIRGSFTASYEREGRSCFLSHAESIISRSWWLETEFVIASSSAIFLDKLDFDPLFLHI